MSPKFSVSQFPCLKTRVTCLKGCLRTGPLFYGESLRLWIVGTMQLLAIIIIVVITFFYNPRNLDSPGQRKEIVVVRHLGLAGQTPQPNGWSTGTFTMLQVGDV